MKSAVFATIALFAALNTVVLASPLGVAKVDRVVNELRVSAPHAAPRTAIKSEMIRGAASLISGPASRAEIAFSDGTRARLGSETTIALPAAGRELALGRGTLLLEVPGFRGGARVRVGDLIAVCGEATLLVEHLPAQFLKLVVLSGDVRVTTGGFFGDSVLIPPGKMLITPPNAKRIPDSVDVDLAMLAKTSALIDAGAFAPGATPLASLPRIRNEVVRQAGLLKAKRLIPTNLAIQGSGTNIMIPEAQQEPGASAVGDGGSDESASRRNETENRDPAAVALHQTGEVIPPAGDDTLSKPQIP